MEIRERGRRITFIRGKGGKLPVAPYLVKARKLAYRLLLKGIARREELDG